MVLGASGYGMALGGSTSESCHTLGRDRVGCCSAGGPYVVIPFGMKSGAEGCIQVLGSSDFRLF